MHVVVTAAPPFFKNGYLVSCEVTGEGVLIDPGDDVDEQLREVETGRVAVQAILLTHAHLDHISGVRRARQALGAAIWLHRDDLFLYDAAVEQGQMFGIRIERQPPVDTFFSPGVPFRFGRHVVDVLHTPGHCPGGVCLAIGRDREPERELFVGDTLFAGSIGRTDLPGGDPDVLLESIRRVLFAFPDRTVVHPGHGPATTIGTERAGNPFLVP